MLRGLRRRRHLPLRVAQKISARFLSIARRLSNAGCACAGGIFFFYATFGLVVTIFVRIAGVLLVFSYLIVPAVCAVTLARRDFHAGC